MLDLSRIREKIDGTDREILRLFEERMRLTEEVAAFKIETGKPVFDREREQSKLESLGGAATGAFNAKGIQELFRQIMSISRKRQYQLLAGKQPQEILDYTAVDRLPVEGKRIIFQGEKGAYTFEAMRSFFGEEAKSSHVETWKEAMELTASGAADYAVLPIENSTAGIVQDIYDLMTEYPNYIVGEQILGIEHMLMGVPGASLEEIRTVYSHPQALSQCRKYLEQHPQWAQRSMLNTVWAAKKVAEDRDASQAAIGSRMAAECFGLEILKDGGMSQSSNATRFVVLSGKPEFVRTAGKISIYFELPHASGSLYNMLSHFIYNDLNMTKIESRPIAGRNWEYRFFVDFEGNLGDAAVKNALFGIESEASRLRILGNY